MHANTGYRAPRVAPEKADFRPALALRPQPGWNGPTMNGKPSYREQLLHPSWQRRRLERLQACDWRCQACESRDRTLHVHHKRYVKGRMVWEYSDDELAVLCVDCHETAGAVREQLMAVLCLARTDSREGATEEDLTALSAAYLTVAGGGSGDLACSDVLCDAALLRRRAYQCGRVAAALADSALSIGALCTLESIVRNESESLLRAIQASDDALAAQVARDMGWSS